MPTKILTYDKLDDRPTWRRQAVIYETPFLNTSGRCTHATVLLP